MDLCSGGGGPAATMADELAKRGRAVTVTLTDLYPNVAAFEHVAAGSGGAVVGRREPVDATHVPADLAGVRTIFNAFHHFRLEQARGILADAVAQRQPTVFEVVSRELLLGLLLTLLTVTLHAALAPVSLGVGSLDLAHPGHAALRAVDGLVSWLRIYSVPELQALVADLDAPDWVWDIGTIQLGNAPLHRDIPGGLPQPPG
ncbi:MAG: class I SAM-dependent methyltransferase [Sandaracinaceae bacterium]|nr:class I SAM-dependent methyltransferase [Sandaracinaceae bacterium]